LSEAFGAEEYDVFILKKSYVKVMENMNGL